MRVLFFLIFFLVLFLAVKSRIRSGLGRLRVNLIQRGVEPAGADL